MSESQKMLDNIKDWISSRMRIRVNGEDITDQSLAHKWKMFGLLSRIERARNPE